MKRTSSRILLTLLVMASCKSNEPLSAPQARQIANRVLTEQSSQTFLDKLEVKTVDLGDSWKLTYSIKGGSTGGPIIFVIDKRTGQIKDMKSWQ